MGLHYGEIMVSSGVDINRAFSLTEEQKAFAKDALPVYEKVVPELLNEIKGFVV